MEPGSSSRGREGGEERGGGGAGAFCGRLRGFDWSAVADSGIGMISVSSNYFSVMRARVTWRLVFFERVERERHANPPLDLVRLRRRAAHMFLVSAGGHPAGRFFVFGFWVFVCNFIYFEIEYVYEYGYPKAVEIR